MTEAVPMPDGPAKGALMQRAAGLRLRIKSATRIVMALQATALILMGGRSLRMIPCQLSGSDPDLTLVPGVVKTGGFSASFSVIADRGQTRV